MRTLKQRLKAERDRVATELKLAVQQQEVASQFAEKARLAYDRGDIRSAELYQRESTGRHEWAQQHLTRARTR